MTDVLLRKRESIETWRDKHDVAVETDWSYVATSPAELKPSEAGFFPKAFGRREALPTP
jgi:hypothetical protein